MNNKRSDYVERSLRPFYGWYIVVAASIVVSFCFGLAYYNNPVFYPPYIEEFRWNRTEVAAGAGVNFLVFGLMSPFIGMLADKLSVKKIILAGILCDAVAKIAFSFMNGLPYYYLTNVLVGIGMACTSMLTVKLLISKWFKKREGTALGIVIAATAVGGGIGPVLTSYLLSEYGWRVVQLVLGVIIFVIVVPVFWFVVRDRPQDLGLSVDGDPVPQPGAPSGISFEVPDLTLRQALTTPSFWLICSAILLFHVCVISIIQHFVLLLTDKGLDLRSASAGLSVLLSASIVGRLGFGALSDKYSKKQLIILAYLILAVMSCTLFLIGTPWLSSFAKSTAAIYVVAALIGIGYGGGIVSVPIVAGTCFGLSSLGKILGLIMLFNAIGGTIGPILAGHLFDMTGSYQWSFFLVSMAAFLAVGCLSFIKTDLRAMKQAPSLAA
jgi:MFS family permease